MTQDTYGYGIQGQSGIKNVKKSASMGIYARSTVEWHLECESIEGLSR
jgi:hypothetical protein